MNNDNLIVNQIITLLESANDLADPVEVHSKLLLAHNFMDENKIATAAVTKSRDIKINPLDWWERKLLSIISNNFNVKYHIHSKMVKNHYSHEFLIIFIGFIQDVRVAKDTFEFLHDELNKFTEHFIENYNTKRVLSLPQITTAEIDSYRSGILRGFDTHFDEIIQGKQLKIRKNEDAKLNWRYLPLFERIAHYEGYVDCNGFEKK